MLEAVLLGQNSGFISKRFAFLHTRSTSDIGSRTTRTSDASQQESDEARFTRNVKAKTRSRCHELDNRFRSAGSLQEGKELLRFREILKPKQNNQRPNTEKQSKRLTPAKSATRWVGASFLSWTPLAVLTAFISAAKSSSYREERWSSSWRYRTTVAKPLDTKASATFLQNKKQNVNLQRPQMAGTLKGAYTPPMRTVQQVFSGKLALAGCT